MLNAKPKKWVELWRSVPLTRQGESLREAEFGALLGPPVQITIRVANGALSLPRVHAVVVRHHLAADP